MEKEKWYVGAKKNPDGSLDLSQAAIFKPKEKSMQNEAKQGSNLTPEQQKIVNERGNKAKALFAAFERGGGSTEVQETKLKVKDLTETLEMHKKDPRMRNDKETLEWFEREIELNQRVVNGERLVDVLDSMRTDEAKKRIEAARERLKNMKQL